MPWGRVTQLHLHISVLKPWASHHSSQRWILAREEKAPAASCRFTTLAHTAVLPFLSVICVHIVYLKVTLCARERDFFSIISNTLSSTEEKKRKSFALTFLKKVAGYVNSHKWSQGEEFVEDSQWIQLEGGAEALYGSRAEHTGEKLCFKALKIFKGKIPEILCLPAEMPPAI